MPIYGAYFPQPMLAVGADGRYHVAFDRHADGDVARVVAAMQGLETLDRVVIDVPAPAFDGGDYSGLAAVPDGAFAVWPSQAADTWHLRGARVTMR